jgi:hypothetical protein
MNGCIRPKGEWTDRALKVNFRITQFRLVLLAFFFVGFFEVRSCFTFASPSRVKNRYPCGVNLRFNRCLNEFQFCGGESHSKRSPRSTSLTDPPLEHTICTISASCPFRLSSPINARSPGKVQTFYQRRGDEIYNSKVRGVPRPSHRSTC